MIVSWQAWIARYKPRTTECTGSGKCGTHLPGLVSRSVASKPQDSCALQECAAQVKADPRSQPEKAIDKILAQTLFIASFTPFARVGYGSDTTDVRTTTGFAYAAFVTDVFSRKTVGWALSDSMRTEAPPLQALNQTITSAKETSRLIRHSDHSNQYVSIVYNERPADAGIAPSTGTVRDCYDNALAEDVNRSYKNESIHTRT